MTVPTQPVTVNLADFGGPAIEGVVVKARLSDIDYTNDGVFVSTETVSATTDATGTAVLNLFPNSVDEGLGTRGTVVIFTAAIPGSRNLRVEAVIPNEACNLVDCLVNDAAPSGVLYTPPVQFQSYTALRNYSGPRDAAYVTTPGIAGLFTLDDSDTTSADNGGTILVGAGGRRWKRVYDGLVDVRWFGAKGSGAEADNDTAAFVAALASHDVVKAPKPQVSYRVSAITLQAGKTLLTDGVETEFHQLPGQPSATPIFTIAGSNVTFGDATFRGNIATDTGEWNHGIQVRGAGDIKNIKIGDLIGIDMRGDVLYVGGLLTAKVNDLTHGRVYGDNILRNVISITGGENIRGEACICLNAAGYATYDVEPNTNSQACDGIYCGYVKGRRCAVAGSNGYPVGKVEFGEVDLNEDYQTNTTPPYSGFDGIQHGGLILRAFDVVRIGILKTHNFTRRGIWHPSTTGDYVAGLVEIGYLEQSNCSLADPDYTAYNTLSASFLKSLVINGGKLTFQDSTRYGFVGAPLTVRNLQANGKIADLCTRPRFENVEVESTFDVYVASGTGNNLYSPIFEKCKINFTGAVGRLTNSPNATVIDSDITVGTFFVPSSTSARLINTTVNGVHYKSGNYLREYTAPERFGSLRTWWDATGELRQKTTDPTSDTDGTLVALKHVADYTALRAYAGASTEVIVTGYLGSAAPSGTAGRFVRDDADTTSADNGGTIIVASNGKRWKRVFSGPVQALWFGTDGAAIQAAVNSITATGGVVEVSAREWLVTGTASTDTKLNGIVIPYSTQIDPEKRITLRFARGAVLKANSNNMIVLRVSDSFAVIDAPTIDGNGFTGVWGIGIVPEDMAQTTTRVDQSYVNIHYPFISDCEEGIVQQAGPRVGGLDSACFYNWIWGGHLYNCTRGLWRKAGPNANAATVNAGGSVGLRIGGTCNAGIDIEAGSGNSDVMTGFESINDGVSPRATPTAYRVIQTASTGADNNDNILDQPRFESNTRDVENANATTSITNAKNLSGTKCLFTALPKNVGSNSSSLAPQVGMAGALQYQSNSYIAGLPLTVLRVLGRGIELDSSDVFKIYDKGFEWADFALTTSNVTNATSISTSLSKYQRTGGFVEWHFRIEFQATVAADPVTIALPRAPETALYVTATLMRAMRTPVTVWNGVGQATSYAEFGAAVLTVPNGGGNWNTGSSTNEIYGCIRFREQGV